jgi:glycosyltransferase involved in cell wall biosynthesis
MRVLLVSHLCAIGGAETFMLVLRSGLEAAGHQCELMFFKHGPLERYLPGDAVVHFGDVADCVRLVARRDFDVVHARSSDWPMGLAAVRRVGAKLIVTSHGLIGSTWTSTTCHALVACARWLADEQQRLTDLPVRVVLNGIDTHRFTPDAAAPPVGPPIVGWVGRGIERRKRIDRCAAIAPALSEAGMRLWLAEPWGPEMVGPRTVPGAADTLKKLAEFWGPVATESMPDFYRTIAASGGCVVSTADWEGLPLVLLEAQACGCPVVAPDVRGTNECVTPDHGGVLYPADLPSVDLARLIIDTVSDTTRLRARGRQCADYVREQFSAVRMAAEYLRIYEQAPDRPVARTWTHRLSPQRQWREYLEQRWPEGERQYEVSRALANGGEWELARAAARGSLMTSPTIYLRAGRLAHLAKTHLRTGRAEG